MTLERARHYIGNHWRGEQGFLWSLVVNLAALRIAVFALQEVLKPAKGTDYNEQTGIVLALAFLVHGPLFIWQVVGVFRAGEAHIRQHGAIAAHWGAQLLAIIAFWFTANYALSAWQMTLEAPQHEDISATMERERVGKYEIAERPDGLIAFTGSIELGVTRKLSSLLESGTYVTVELQSVGGNIYEARGLAKLFTTHDITTRVTGECSSACTTAFIGGTKRQIKSGARLGYHSYRIDADYVVLGADTKREEEKDRALHAAAGVGTSFISRMHEAPPGDMWYPDAATLLKAGVVTEVVE